MNKKQLSLMFYLLACTSIIGQTIPICPSLEQNTQQQKYTLNNFITHAKNARSDILAQEKLIEQQQAKELTWISKHLPQITIQYITQKSQKDVLPEQQLQLTLQQALFAPATLYYPYELARLGTSISKTQLELEKNRAQLALEQAFFDFQATFAKQEIASALGKTVPEELKKARIQFEQGLLSTIDFEQQQTNYLTSLLTIEKIIQGAELTTQQIAITTEQEANINETQWISLEKIKNNLNKLLSCSEKALYTQALAKRPELMLLTKGIQQAELQKKMYGAQYLPTASLFTSMYATSKPDNALSTAEDLLNYPWTVGLKLSWCFDSLSNMFEIRAAHAEYLTQMLKKKRSEWIIEKEINESISLLSIDYQALQEAEQVYSYGKKHFDRKQLEITSGLAAPIELLQAQVQWEQTKAKYVEAHTTAAKNCAVLINRTGNTNYSELNS